MAENIETPEITGQSQEAQTSAGGNAASKISSMLKGLQNFNVADFVKGKPGQWQKMAVVAVVVIIVMGLGAVMMWGLALWALANSFGEPAASDYGGVGSNFRVIKTMEVYVTMYSPYVVSDGIVNDCDAQIYGGQPMGGGHGGSFASSADGSIFRLVNGKFQIKTSKGGRILDRIFAQSQDYNIIPRSRDYKEWNSQAVQVPGFNNDIPIEIHDVYGSRMHRGEGNNNFLDLSFTCSEKEEIARQLRETQQKQGLSGTKEGGILLKINVVERESASAASNSMWSSAAEAVAAIGGFPVRGKNIVSYKFMGRNISGGVNKYIVPALDKIQAELKAKGVTYNFRDVQGYNWRHNVNNTRYISPHALGLAIDINPFNPNDNCNPRPNSCQPRDPSPSCCRHDIPPEVSETFEKHGFFWGAKFYKISDPMHFQYGGNYGTNSILWNGGNPTIVNSK